MTIRVYRHKGHRWVLSTQVSATNADSGGDTRYEAKVKLAAKGKYRFQAYTLPTVTWAGASTGFSRVLTVR